MLLSYRAPAASASAPLDQAVLPKVYDESFREVSDLRVERVVHALGAEPSRAEFAIVLDSYRRWKDSSGNVHEGAFGFEQAVPPGSLSVGIDDVVYVALPLGAGRVLVIFRGRITDVDVSFSESGDGARITALGPAHALDNADLRGARYADGAGGVVETDVPLVFNPDNLGNCDIDASRAQGELLFGDPGEPDRQKANPFERYWTIGMFWEYIVGNFAPEGNCRASVADVPLVDDADDAYLPPTDVDGWKPSAALSRVLGAYGLDWWTDPFVIVNRWSVWGPAPLPVFRIVSPRASAVKSVQLQPRGEEFSPLATNIDSGAMSFTTRGSVNHWRIEGDYKEYEACFELTPLWTTSEGQQISYNPNKGNRAHEDYDLSLDHVYRQWGLNEDGACEQRDTFDFASLLGEGTWTKRRRRFFAPYSETDDTPRKCVVEIKSATLDDDWHRVGSATVRLLSDRAGIYFDMSDVGGAVSRLRVESDQTLALMDVTHVRITAIVKSDSRVVYDAPREETAGSSQTVMKVAQDESCRWVKRHSSSPYSGGSTQVVRTDAEAGGSMDKLASRLRGETESLGQSVRFSLPWVDVSYRAGDRISDVDGRSIHLEAKPGGEPAFPKIAQITYDFHAQRTEVELSPPTANVGPGTVEEIAL